MSLPKTNSGTGCLAAIVFIIMGLFTGDLGYFVAAIVWFLISVIFEDDD